MALLKKMRVTLKQSGM
ncbi:hypothetical protein BIW11_03538 [Tropilaelaps mercedesae]|uniref:Uncharacterized protein n=1 Tax=Tropilaelaps mercedesae TaxID=418985 RepID=A0A1V9XJA4_9ACAR|nr:hypothetical protein BIW11_03538 [Tropilaelaps mercedesae]